MFSSFNHIIPIIPNNNPTLQATATSMLAHFTYTAQLPAYTHASISCHDEYMAYVYVYVYVYEYLEYHW
jgi:hypothetical protein